MKIHGAYPQFASPKPFLNSMPTGSTVCFKGKVGRVCRDFRYADRSGESQHEGGMSLAGTANRQGGDGYIPA